MDCYSQTSSIAGTIEPNWQTTCLVIQGTWVQINDWCVLVSPILLQDNQYVTMMIQHEENWEKQRKV